jgi:hypothetical protein
MDLALRFLLGGILVSAFAAIGTAFTPKTFAGLFGSAPPVALAGLGWAFSHEGRPHVTILANSMIIGAAALFVYALACVWVAQHRRVWLLPGALAAWLAWFTTAGIMLRAFGIR